VVLSGFVLTWSAKPAKRTGAFIRRRLVKIFPNHLVLWVVAMLLVPAAAATAVAPVANLFLVHAWFPSPKIFISINSPSWSLCVELLFYVLFPFFIKLVRRIAENRLWAWAGVVLAAIVAIGLINYFLVPDHPRSPLLPRAILQQ